MKLVQVLFICLLYSQSIQCTQKNELFLKIGSYNYGYSVKEIFLSKDLEETWMNSYFICLNQGMELLRIDTADELLTVISSLKLNWLKFDTKVHLDGIKTKNNGWKYLSNEKELNSELYNLTSIRSAAHDNTEKCMSMHKNGLIPEFSTSDCYFGDVNQFACQKTTQQYTRSVDNDHTLRVNVEKRVLDDIGSHEVFESKHFKRSTYFVNREYSLGTALTMTKALNFCKSFGMKLVDLTDKNKFDSLIRLIVKNENKVNQRFLIGGTRSSQVDSLNWVNFVSSDDNAAHKNCLSVIADPAIGENRQIFYVDCNTKMNFICEKTEKRSKDENLYTRLPEEPMVKRTSGTRHLGSVKLCDKSSQCKMNYYVSDSMYAATWFEAFSYCKAIGMDLFSPTNTAINEQVKTILSKSGYNSTIAVGGSRIGSDCFWYSTKTGLEIEFNDEPAKSNKNCLQLSVDGFNAIECDSGSSHFLCESLE